MPSTPRRILLVRLSHLGDVVHALPVFHALRAAHPAAEIAWAVQPEFAGLLDGLPGLSRVFRFDRRGGAGAWLRLRRELAAWEPDWAVDAQANAKSALATRASGAGRRSGLAASDWREPFAARVLTDSAPPLARDLVHAMDRMLALARHIAPELDGAIPRTDPASSAAELARGEALCAAFFAGARRGVILHLASRDDVRSWSSRHFESLARRLAAQGERVLVLSGPAEEDDGRALAARVAGVAGIEHWIGQRGLRELAGFFTAAAGRGARIVCCDSGPMHLAAACGLPVVCLAGPQDERRTGPWRGAHRSVRAGDAPDCAPCRARRCDHPLGSVCMDRIEPAAVELALTGLTS
ncbi:MAG TPA: glycosyltransferase family 9 protein [Planctomycetota bacterium]|nr:glycosyltransferase family 9 protein [Planctomycetota bacterium]